MIGRIHEGARRCMISRQARVDTRFPREEGVEAFRADQTSR